MTRDLKRVLTYISINLMNFIIISIKKAFLFFLGLVLIITTFFVGLKSGLAFNYLILIIIIFILLLYVLKENIFRNSQIKLNNSFLHFLLNEKQEDNVPIIISKEKFKDVKRIIKEDKNISALKRTVLSFYINSINKKDILKKDKKELKKDLVKIHLTGYFLFFILLLFFELISLALAFGNSIQTDFIIFLAIIGFLFAYALFSIAIDPIMYLLIQNKINELNL